VAKKCKNIVENNIFLCLNLLLLLLLHAEPQHRASLKLYGKHLKSGVNKLRPARAFCAARRTATRT